MPVVIIDAENYNEYFFENNFTIDTIIQIKNFTGYRFQKIR
jgi:hypothetical protein